jgi:Protein of unknown function (DUF1236)
MKKYLISIAALAATSGLVWAAEPAQNPAGKGETPAAAAPSGSTGAGSADIKSDREPANGKAAEGMKPNGDAAKSADPSGSNEKMGKSADGDEKSRASDKGDKASNKNADMKDGDKKPGDMKSGDMKSGDAKSGDMKDASKTGSKGDKAALSKVTPEQKTQVKTIFTKHRVEPATINISVNVGVAIPRETRLYSVPEDILVIAPAYRDYRYFIIGDRVCIVDPDTFEIIDIIVIA